MNRCASCPSRLRTQGHQLLFGLAVLASKALDIGELPPQR